MSKKTQQNLIAIGLIVAFVVAIRMFLGSYELMYLSSKDIDHVDVTTTPPGITAVSTGDDTAQMVKLLRKTVFHGKTNAVPAGQYTTMTLYFHDGTQQKISVCGDYIEVDGVGYSTREKDGAAIAEWAESLSNAPQP